MKTYREKHQGEKDILINEFNEQLNDMREKLERKTNEHGLVQNELNQLKEFRKKKIQMQKELEEVNYFKQFIIYQLIQVDLKLNSWKDQRSYDSQ